MHDLLAWLQEQKGGVRTYEEFQDKALALRLQTPENAALARLLADLAGRFADFYHGRPLPVSVAHEALARLKGYVQRAAEIESAGPAERLALLNELGASDLV